MKIITIETRQRWGVVSVCLLVLVLGSANAQTPVLSEPNTVQITWVANHGFQIADAGKKVMIDTLFTQGGPYPSPSVDTQTKMLQNQAPYNDVDVVLTTHGHADHFELNFAVEYLLQHPNVQFVGPAEVVASIRNHADFNRIQATVTAAQDRTREVFNGIDIESIGMGHHNSPKTQHFMYLIHINGMKILHVGDAAKEPSPLYENLALSDRKIDILMAPFGSDCSNWSVSAQGGPYIIRESIKPKHVILGHIPADWDTQRQIQEKTQLLAALPNISVSILPPQPCPGRLFTREAGLIVDYPIPGGPIENQTTR
ncbi:MBL fold metallo-hydrolase [Planctomycetota bacterium]